jgi:hypothetical protein
VATFEEHCTETQEKLGDRFEFVHEWLDELQPALGPDHRKVRHNKKGIEFVRRCWGDAAAEAARIHIERDEGGYELKGRLWIR